MEAKERVNEWTSEDVEKIKRYNIELEDDLRKERKNVEMYSNLYYKERDKLNRFKDAVKSVTLLID
jgi:hypothetical protein